MYDQRTTSKQKRKGRKKYITTRENSTKRNIAEVWQQFLNDQDDSSTTTQSSCSTDKNSYRNKKVGAVSTNGPPVMVEKGPHPSNVSVFHNDVNVNKTKHAYDPQQSAYDMVQSKKRENSVIMSGLKKYLLKDGTNLLNL